MNTFSIGKDGKYSAISLVKEYFSATLAEMKALTSRDRLELASAVARDAQIPESACNFAFVTY